MMKRLPIVILLALACCLGCTYGSEQMGNFKWRIVWVAGIEAERTLTGSADIVTTTDLTLSSPLMGPPDREPDP